MLSDISSRYHSFTSPLICRDFLFPLLAVSALSTMLTNRIPQAGNKPWMYFSTSSSSRVNRDCVLHSTISNLCCCASRSRPVELRAPPVRACIVVVTINVENVPSLFHRILQQHRFLVLNASGIAGSGPACSCLPLTVGSRAPLSRLCLPAQACAHHSGRARAAPPPSRLLISSAHFCRAVPPKVCLHF